MEQISFGDVKYWKYNLMESLIILIWNKFSGLTIDQIEQRKLGKGRLRSVFLKYVLDYSFFKKKKKEVERARGGGHFRT